MLDVFARSKQPKLCHELFLEIQKDEKLNSQVDVRTFESLIRSCVYDGNVLNAFNYVQMMQSKDYNLKISKHIISDILRSIKYYKGEIDAFELAKKLWKQAVSDNGMIQPDAVMFGIMIDLCYEYNQFEYGLQSFRDMITVYNIKPTIIVFNNLLKCCMAESKSKDYLLNTLDDMKTIYNVHPDHFTYNIILKAIINLTKQELLAIGEVDNAVNEKYLKITELLTFWNHEMLLKNEVSYSTIIHALFELNNIHFKDKLNKNIIDQQLLFLYENAYSNGYLSHWAPDHIYNTEWNQNDYWILEMHGRSRYVAQVSLQYFL